MTVEKRGCFADMELNDSELDEQDDREDRDELIDEQFADYSDDSKEPVLDGEDPDSSESDLMGFDADSSRITGNPNHDDEDGTGIDTGTSADTGTGNTKRSRFLSKLRQYVDGDDIGSDGSLGLGEKKNRKPRSKFKNQKDREEYEWASNTVQVRRFLLEHFPKLMTDVNQRERAGRWSRIIQMYFLARMSDADIVFALYGATSTKDQDRETIKDIAGMKGWRVLKDPNSRKWLKSVKIPEKKSTEFDRLRKQIKKIIYDIRLARQRGAPKKKSGRPKGSKDSFQRKRPKGLRYNVGDAGEIAA